jgi:hypothetical protein
MRTRTAVLGVVAIVMIAASLGAQTRLGGSIRANPPSGPVPRLADGKPSFEGVWKGGGAVGDISTGLPKGETLPLLPQTKKIMAEQLAKEDPQALCLPLPPPRATPYPWRLMFTPTHAFFFYEMYGYRQVFMDGRKHPPADELFPTWWGHSIGWWEGDTLVIDTVGMNDKTWMDNRGNRHSEKMHLIERLTRTDLGHLRIEYTIDDSGAYSKPFTVTFVAELMPANDELLEYVCEENNQDVPYLVGPKVD